MDASARYCQNMGFGYWTIASQWFSPRPIIYLVFNNVTPKTAFVINHDGKYKKIHTAVLLLGIVTKILQKSPRYFQFNLTNCFPSKTFVHYFVTINN